MLAEGGELLYSTCTFSVKENEEVIRRAAGCASGYGSAGNYPGYEGFAPGVSVNGRIFPVRSYFPAADGGGRAISWRSRKTGREPETAAFPPLETTKKLPKEAEEFLAGVRMDWKEWFVCPLVKDQLYFLPEGVCAAKGLRYLRTGLSLGTVKKNRFEPSQALAAYLKKKNTFRV